MKKYHDHPEKRAHKSRNRRSEHDEPRKKKEHGQVFLRDQGIVDSMLKNSTVTATTTVMEIGCGDGFLTRAIIEKTPCKQLQVFEIDEEWLNVVKESVKSDRLSLNLINVLDVDLRTYFSPQDPIVLLANLPYHITFPIMHLIQRNADLFSHGVVMVQEEVAQRLVAQTGRDAGAISHYFQHFFEFKLLTKVPPSAFEPQPKIFSRLVGFTPRTTLTEIEDLDNFWLFVRACFRLPRQMLHNNLKGTKYSHIELPEEFRALRAQQITTPQFIALWHYIRAAMKPA